MYGVFPNGYAFRQRLQQRPQPHRWARTAMLVGSPMAAAASIVLAILLIVPSVKEQKQGLTAGRIQATSGCAPCQ